MSNPDFDNSNTGVLFRNDNKAGPRHPDYKGTLDVNGVEYWVSGWIKVAGPMARTPGSKFMSLAVTPKVQASSPVPLDNPDEDIPF